MKYRDYNFEDFIKDEFFKEWVKNPNKYSEDFWGSFLQNNPHKREDIQKARYFISSLKFPQPDYVPPSREEIEHSFSEVVYAPHIKTTKRQGRSYYYVAASVSVLFLFSLVWYWLRYEAASPVPESAAEIEFMEKTAPLGQKLTVKLPDGSTVKLNSGSRITFPTSFAEGQRRVSVEGEVFFEVTRNIHNPFIVKSDNIQTTVLGTSFLVKAYKEEKKIQVAVLTGRVMVEKQASPEAGQNDKLFLLPMEAITYSREEDVYQKEKVDYNKVFSWKDNVLYFENASFQEVVNTLSKWYGKEFVVRKEISNERDFSAVYKNQSLELVLEGVSFAFGFNYRIEKNEVIIN